jgi:NAD(P)-dependent dehydrogenase (short-subunit alcohol dehydrogenase family)
MTNNASNDDECSRREIVRRGAAFVLTPALGAAVAQAARAAADSDAPTANTPLSTQGAPNMTTTAMPTTDMQNSPLQDPLTKYPRPPFKTPLQQPPGLACKMVPRPDHGEQSYKGSGKLVGRKALITGGDSGIGRAAAIAFAREGADVAFNYLPVEEPDAKEVVQLIRDAGRKAVPLPGDIQNESFCQQLVENAVNQLGGLDILVSNAAHQQYKPSLTDITTEQFDTTFRINVYAMFWITKAALAHLQPGASIICTTSINAYDPAPGILDYAMTKGAIMIFVKGLAKQLAPKGIRVNGVAPGPFWTPLQPSGGQPPDKLTTFGDESPMGRPGQPAELAPTYVLLASDASSFTSGEILGSTGGKPLP